MTDLENRLRTAFAARADQVTVRSLRPTSPPAPPARTRPHWVFPTIGGLAVAATTAGFLTLSLPRTQATGPAAPPSVTAASTAPTPTPSATSSAAPATPTTSSPAAVPSPSTPPSDGVPTDWRTVSTMSWTARIPPTWRVRNALDPLRDRQTRCLGSARMPCAVVLARSLDTSAYPDVSYVQSLVVADHDQVCRPGPPRDHRLATSGYPTSIVRFRCTGGSATAAVQVWPAKTHQTAVSYRPDDPTVVRVLATLDVDEGAPGPDPSVRETRRGPVVVQLPTAWRQAPGAASLWCPPGARTPCLQHGGLLITQARGTGAGLDPLAAGGTTDGFAGAEEGTGCVGDGETTRQPRTFKVLVDRPLVVDQVAGRYLEFRMTCASGSHLHRRWYFPDAGVLLDSGRTSTRVDTIVRTATFFINGR